MLFLRTPRGLVARRGTWVQSLLLNLSSSVSLGKLANLSPLGTSASSLVKQAQPCQAHRVMGASTCVDCLAGCRYVVGV